jgi:hypothetical protein
MIDATQIKADFNKLRDPNHEHGVIVTMGFGGQTCRAIKSTRVESVRLNDFGEEVGDLFTLRFLVTDFNTPPKEKDVVTVNGVEYQVGEVRTSGFGQIMRAYIIDEDS